MAIINDAYWQDNTTPIKVMEMSGNTPPTEMATTTAAPTNMTTGGNLPPLAAPTGLDGSQRTLNGADYVAQLQPGQAPGSQFSPVNTTMGSLDQIMSTDNPYMRNAKRRGMDAANSRGVMNSNMAGGLAQSAAVDGAMPMFQEAMTLHRQREGQAFQGQQAALDRTQQVNRDMLGAELGDWLQGNQFTREFNGALSLMPVKNAMDLTRAVSEYAIENPELYTPQIVSGMSEFFSRNSLAIMQSYFPSMIPTSGGG